MTQFASADELRQLKKVFHALDTNADGFLTKTELEKGYSKLMPGQTEKAEVDTIFKNFDYDGNNIINASSKKGPSNARVEVPPTKNREHLVGGKYFWPC